MSKLLGVRFYYRTDDGGLAAHDLRVARDKSTAPSPDLIDCIAFTTTARDVVKGCLIPNSDGEKGNWDLGEPDDAGPWPHDNAPKTHGAERPDAGDPDDDPVTEHTVWLHQADCHWIEWP